MGGFFTRFSPSTGSEGDDDRKLQSETTMGRGKWKAFSTTMKVIIVAELTGAVAAIAAFGGFLYVKTDQGQWATRSI